MKGHRPFTDDPTQGTHHDHNTRTSDLHPTPQSSFTIKIKKSDDSQVLKVSIKGESGETVRELKERVFHKEIMSRDETGGGGGKNVRLIYQGKVLQDPDLVSKYGLKEGIFVHAFITDQVLTNAPRRDGENPTGNEVQNSGQQQNNTSSTTEADEKIGFDRLLQNAAYSEIEVHAIRLQFHSIMMRVGIEKTNETSESLLENEEKWLNKQLPSANSKFAQLTLEELRNMPSILSLRNDLVLPRYYYQPATFEKEGKYIDFLKGFFKGFLLSGFFFILYLIWNSQPSNN